MPQALIGAVAAPIVGGLVGKALGPKQPQAQAMVPKDLQGTRTHQLGLLNYLTGMGGPGGGFNMQTGQWGNTSQPQLPGGGFGPPGNSPSPLMRGAQGIGGAGSGLMGAFGGNNNLSLKDFAQGGFGNLFQRASGGGGAGGGPVPQQGQGNVGFGGPTIGPGIPGADNGPAGFSGPGFNEPTAPGVDGLAGRIQSFFGQTGINTNPLQNTAAQSANRMLTQQSPEQRALEAAFPNLQQTGLNPTATGRLQQGATQSGLPGASGNYYQNLLTNGPGNLGPGGDVEALLRQIGASGGNLTQTQGLGGPSGAEGFLSQLLAQNPASQVNSLLQSQFEKNLALANQAGGRFGSANALQRADVTAQQNADLANRLQQGVGQQLQGAGLLGQLVQNQRAQMLQAAQQQVANQLGAAGQLGGFRQQGAISGLQGQLQGAGALGSLGLQDIGQQLGAAGTLGQQGLAGQGNILQGAGILGQLAQGAGQGQRQDILNGFNIGTGLANQGDVQTQRNLAIIMNLLGAGQQASLNQPTEVTPSGFQQGAGFGGGIANILTSALPYLLPGGRSGGGGLPSIIPDNYGA